MPEPVKNQLATTTRKGTTRFDTLGPADVRIARTPSGIGVYADAWMQHAYAHFSGGKDPMARAQKYAARLRLAILGAR